MAVALPQGKQHFDTPTGGPGVGYRLYTYIPGTSTPKATYTTSGAGVANTNPVVMDARGDAAVYWVGDYDVILKDAADATIWGPERLNEPETAGTSATAVALVRSDLASTSDSAKGDALVGVLGSGSGAIATTQHEVNSRTVSVFDFLSSAQKADVLAGTASLDVRAALANAVAAARGRRLIFPKGQYLINTDGGSITLEEVALEGEYVLDGATATLDQGAVLRFTGTTNSPFKIRRGTTLKGLGFFYPNQTDSATPTVYPYTLDFDFTNGAVQFVYITENVVYNAYNFCRMDDAGGAVGHVWVENNTIYAINLCFSITYNAEVIKFRGNTFTFGHWLASTEAGSRAYTRANGVILQYPKGDGIFFSDNLCYGYLNGLLMAATGLVQLCRITGNTFDTTRFGVIASGSGNFTTSQIVGNDFYSVNPQNTALQGRGVSINTTGSTAELVTISGNTFAASTEEAVFINQTSTRTLTIAGNTFNAWATAKAAGMYYAIGGTGTNTSYVITGNNFAGGSSAFQGGIGSTCLRATIGSNMFTSMQNPISVSATTVTMTGNTSLATGGASTDQIFTAVPYSFGNNFDKPVLPAVNLPIAAVPNYANDAAAAAGSVPIGGWYRNGSVLQIRVA